MGHKSPNLTLSFPSCRHCGRRSKLASNIVADTAYCGLCARERQAIATERFGLRPIKSTDLIGKVLLPRRFRPG